MNGRPCSRILETDAITIGSFASAARNATGVVVVIDVVRAFTTAAIALANGAARIVMLDDLDAALALRKRGVGRYCLGERRGLKPPGFDFGNSPAEIGNVRFDGETLIQTTSNGTRGIAATTNSERLYAGSLVTAEATVQAILAGPEARVSLVAMGEKERIRADEDEICALYLRSRLLGRQPDPTALEALVKTMSRQADTEALSMEDIECCLRTNTVSFAVRVMVGGGLCVATAEYVNS